MTRNSSLLATVQSAGEDFEWYPTTRKMLEIVARDLRAEMGDRDETDFSILDIGAGDGGALRALCELTRNTGQKYAIEKSRVLTDALPEDVFVIGTDFYQQTLIDKVVDVVFCNPPYSDFETWMRRIVSEANCQLIYLVVPRRWKDNAFVQDMIKRRIGTADEADPEWDESTRRAVKRAEGGCEVLGSMSFEASEHRRARAQVDILKIKTRSTDRYNDDGTADPFNIWFETTFAINADKAAESDFEGGQKAAENLRELVRGQNVIERLEELYRADFDRLLGVYRDLEKLNRDLFKELGVDLPKVREGLKAKIKGLKALYWQELFNNLDTITNRLTSQSRTAMLDKLTAHTSIDFTADNAYAVVVWAIKNANAYFDRQLLEVYLELANKENIRNYKSNTRLVTDEWRYIEKGKHTHYTLDYRLVLNRHSCFSSESFRSFDYPNGLYQGVHTLLGDLCTVARNLGFTVATDSRSLRWCPGERQEFHAPDGALLMDVRAFKKGTIHIRLDQDFMRKLNIEAGRLNGWVKSPAEAAQETGIENAADLYGCNFKLTSIPLLPAPSTARKDLPPANDDGPSDRDPPKDDPPAPASHGADLSTPEGAQRELFAAIQAMEDGEDTDERITAAQAALARLCPPRQHEPRRPDPTMFSVESSNIAAVGYIPGQQLLRVRFHNGGVYDYDRVPEDVHAALVNAESIGGYFAATIKADPKRYPCRKVREAVRADLRAQQVAEITRLKAENEKLRTRQSRTNRKVAA